MYFLQLTQLPVSRLGGTDHCSVSVGHLWDRVAHCTVQHWERTVHVASLNPDLSMVLDVSCFCIEHDAV